MIQADLSDPSPAGLFDRGPRAKPALTPEPKDPGMGLLRFLVGQWPVLMGDVSHDVGISEQMSILVQVSGPPGAQHKMNGLDLTGHRESSQGTIEKETM